MIYDHFTTIWHNKTLGYNLYFISQLGKIQADALMNVSVVDSKLRPPANLQQIHQSFKTPLHFVTCSTAASRPKFK